jgi:MoaA/NifB/PqqE/SkfB family radical SAM enzyme
MRVISNGILLRNEICQAFAGNLHRLRVSLNAATQETWETLMQTRGFESVCQGISTLARLKKEKRTKHPEIILMMVVCRENVAEVVKFAELAHQLGAQGVNYSHFSKSVMNSCKMDVHSSLYFAKEEADLWLGRAEKRAKELGLKVFDRPIPFSQQEKGYFWGERTVNVSEKCLFPWQTCYFGRSRKGKSKPLMGFCCSGVESRIVYDLSSLDEESFCKLWNHPYLHYFRKTANSGKAHDLNPVCNFCKTVDQSDPKIWIDHLSDCMKTGSIQCTTYEGFCEEDAI